MSIMASECRADAVVVSSPIECDPHLCSLYCPPQVDRPHGPSLSSQRCDDSTSPRLAYIHSYGVLCLLLSGAGNPRVAVG